MDGLRGAAALGDGPDHERLSAAHVARRKNASTYSQLLKGVPGVATPVEAPWAEHIYHQYTIRVVNRDRVQSALTEQGIGTTVYYPTPMHLQPVFAASRIRGGVVAERLFESGLCLPSGSSLTDAQRDFVVETVVGTPGRTAAA